MRKCFVGLDVHWTHTNVCILDARGKKVKRLTVRGAWSKVIDELGELRGRLFVCYEASCGYGYLYDLLSKVARRVVVAHPGQLRLIFRSKRKNDRVDADTTRRYFERIEPGNRDRKKIAIVATAHDLARVMLAMLRTGEAGVNTKNSANTTKRERYTSSGTAAETP